MPIILRAPMPPPAAPILRLDAAAPRRHASVLLRRFTQRLPPLLRLLPRCYCFRRCRSWIFVTPLIFPPDTIDAASRRFAAPPRAASPLSRQPPACHAAMPPASTHFCDAAADARDAARLMPAIRRRATPLPRRLFAALPPGYCHRRRRRHAECPFRRATPPNIEAHAMLLLPLLTAAAVMACEVLRRRARRGAAAGVRVRRRSAQQVRQRAMRVKERGAAAPLRERARREI